ncbi:phosphorothioated DNA-binding restriction endonuclease [Streptomyces fenghuangensis]|uniref:phosphorothioated DNA-binding restriction endonuclease n=1 Tax=Streptomyces sp. ICN903 TaxID=2964654 RepID=UPI0035B3C23B
MATKDELLSALAGLRRAPVAGRRAPHKPLLLLWLLGRFAATGSTAAAYGEAEEPVGRMIDDYGPPARSTDRAAMPFVHLERALWDLRDADGRLIPPSAPERGSWLRARGATGRLHAPVERLLADPGTLAAAARLLLDLHFTPALEPAIRADTGLDLTALDLTALDLTAVEEAALTLGARRRRPRRTEFTRQVLHAYARACAMCGYDGALGRHPAGLEAAHVRWHSQDGPDEPSNGLALCALHHALFDLGALGLTLDLRIRVSPRYTARGPAGRAVGALDGAPLARPRPGLPPVDPVFVKWHDRQVFKHGGRAVPA